MTQNSNDFLPPDLAALGVDPVPSAGAASADDMAPFEALQRHHDALMAKDGVVMVGETRDAIGNRAILVGVKTARDLRKVPASLDGVPIVLQVIGEIDAQ